MFTKMNVKKYLKTKETFTLFDDVLSFYTTLYMKEVFRFWGLKQISITITWENDVPKALNLSSIYDNTTFNWTFNETECIGQTGDENHISLMTSYTDIHQLFDFLRDQLPQKVM